MNELELSLTLQTVWELPPYFSSDLGKYFLLKWHQSYLQDKTHLEVGRDLAGNTTLIPYIYRDEIKFYIISYDGSQLPDSDHFWLSFRKATDQSYGYVLIKKAKNTSNNDLLYTGVTRS